MFIATNDGKIINTDHIVSADVPGQGRGFSVAFVDGRTERLSLPISDLDDLCGTIIPAPPGFAVIEVCVPPAAEAADGVLCLDPRSVIAFRIGGPSDRPVPITASGPVSTSNGWTYAVRGPEGGWDGPDEDYASVEGFKAACERELARAVARHSTAAA